MAVKIRLARHGSKKRPYYRVVVADSRTRRDGRPIEEVGRYNPMTTPKTISLDLEKIADWQSKGAQLTDAVAALVKAANEGEKTAAAPKKSKKQLAKEAEEAARMAISSPLLETSINGAKGVLVNVTGSMDIGLEEVEQAATLVQQAVHPDALTIFGATFDEELDDEIRVTVIATGFESNDQQEAPAAADTQQPTQDDAAAPAAAPQPLDETEGEKAEESDVDRSFDEILKIFSRGDKF